MHHFGEDSFTVFPTPTGYDIIFTNRTTGKQIRMNFPREGLFDDPLREISGDEVENVAREISHIFRNRLV